MRPGIGRNTSCASGDCLTSRPEGRSWPRKLWFSIYSCACVHFPYFSTDGSETTSCLCDHPGLLPWSPRETETGEQPLDTGGEEEDSDHSCIPLCSTPCSEPSLIAALKLRSSLSPDCSSCSTQRRKTTTDL